MGEAQTGAADDDDVGHSAHDRESACQAISKNSHAVTVEAAADNSSSGGAFE